MRRAIRSVSPRRPVTVADAVAVFSFRNRHPLKQLARGSKYITTSRAELDLEESIRASLWARRVANGGTSTARVVREQFLDWVQVQALIQPDLRAHRALARWSNYLL